MTIYQIEHYLGAGAESGFDYVTGTDDEDALETWAAQVRGSWRTVEPDDMNSMIEELENEGYTREEAYQQLDNNYVGINGGEYYLNIEGLKLKAIDNRTYEAIMQYALAVYGNTSDVNVGISADRVLNDNARAVSDMKAVKAPKNAIALVQSCAPKAESKSKSKAASKSKASSSKSKAAKKAPAKSSASKARTVAGKVQSKAKKAAVSASKRAAKKTVKKAVKQTIRSASKKASASRKG